MTFTATFSSTEGTPTGAAVFTDGVGNPIRVGCTNSSSYFVPVVNGTATCVLRAAELPPGAHLISAFYASDDARKFAGSHGSVPQPVTKAATTTTVSSPANPAARGQAVTFGADVAPSPAVPIDAAPPSGTVTFSDGQTTLCTAAALTSAGHASCTSSTLSVGSHSVTATYNGDGNYSGSTSASAVEQTIIGPPTANAGPDQTVPPNSVARLDGSGSTDPQNEPLTYSWTQVDGPAATIADPTDPKTAVTVPGGIGRRDPAADRDQQLRALEHQPGRPPRQGAEVAQPVWASRPRSSEAPPMGRRGRLRSAGWSGCRWLGHRRTTRCLGGQAPGRS